MVIQKDRHWTVNKFEMIGWIDPYPNELDVKNKRFEPNQKFVYDESRLIQYRAPFVVYIPKRLILSNRQIASQIMILKSRIVSLI